MATPNDSSQPLLGRIIALGVGCVGISLVMYFFVRSSTGADIGFFISNLFLITGLILLLLGLGVYRELKEMKKALHNELQTVEERFSGVVMKGLTDVAHDFSQRIKFSDL